MTQQMIAFAKRASFLAVIAAIFVAMAMAVLVRESYMLFRTGPGLSEASPVIAAEVVERPFADVITAVGTALANESVTVTSKVADVVSRVAFDSGDHVEGGQVLVELASTEETALLNEARATLAEANRERDRMARLLEAEAAPAQLVDEAQSNYQRAAAQVTAIEARMADRLIRAPFDGIVGLRNISAGERIDTGTVIATLNDISVIKLDFQLPERFLSSIARGQDVEARAAAWPGEVFGGRVTAIDNRVDPVSRTVTVRAELANDDARLAPGMLMRVELRRDQRERPAIPESALMRFAEQSYVYVIAETDEGLVAEEREVQPGLRAGGYVEILDGLQPGERVIADGAHRTRDGAPVRIVEEVSPEDDAEQPELLSQSDPGEREPAGAPL